MEFKDFLVETSFAKIVKTLRGDIPHINQLGIMTAQNPLEQQYTLQNNDLRNKKLISILDNMNLKYYSIVPQMIMVKLNNIENSFMIPHISKEELINLGAQFGQMAVIWGEKQTNDEKSYVRFEYIDTPEKEMPINPTSYRTSYTSDIVISEPCRFMIPFSKRK